MIRTDQQRRPFIVLPLVALLVFLGIGGTVGGAMLTLAPDGSLLGMAPDWLEGSPFSNYVIPGLILFTFNGVLPLLAAYGLVRTPNWRWPDALNIYHNRHWCWTYTLYSGIVVITWITIQLVLTRYFWLQPVMIFTGLFIIIMVLTPTVMRHYER